MEEIIELTKQLMEFRTMHSQPEEIKRCAIFIEDYLKNNGIQYRTVMHDDIPSIIVLPTTTYTPVLLMSHLDVVSATDNLFTPIERDGNLYGRGSLDDKYAVALSLVLFKNHLEKLGDQSKIKFGLLITSDEEQGGFKGAKLTLPEIRSDFGIAIDGGNNDNVIIKNKGVCKAKLIARGKTAHGSRPWLGKNAIEMLIRDYGIIKSHFTQPADSDWYKTINIGIVNAGKSFNQVPDYAEAILDIRYTEYDNLEELFTSINEAIEGELIIELKEPMFFGGSSPYLEKLKKLYPSVKLSSEHGASDARFFSENNIPGIVWGAEGNQSCHSTDEHVNIDSVYKFYNLLDQFLS